MLLALRSLWEQAPKPPALGGGVRVPRVNFGDFVKLSEFLKVAKKKPRQLPGLALSLYVGGLIDATTFAALLAASRE